MIYIFFLYEKKVSPFTVKKNGQKFVRNSNFEYSGSTVRNANILKKKSNEKR